MTANAIAHAATAAVKSAAAHSGSELPLQSRSLQTADFERLMSQAQEQQAQVQLANPVGEVGQRGMRHVSKTISTASHSYQASMEASRTAIAQVDLRDPASIAKFGDQVLETAVRNIELKLMIDGVSSTRKSLGELFKSQG